MVCWQYNVWTISNCFLILNLIIDYYLSLLLQVAGGNGAGNTANKLSSPWGIYVNTNRSVFVVDRGNHRVQKWDFG